MTSPDFFQIRITKDDTPHDIIDKVNDLIWLYDVQFEPVKHSEHIVYDLKVIPKEEKTKMITDCEKEVDKLINNFGMKSVLESLIAIVNEEAFDCGHDEHEKRHLSYLIPLHDNLKKTLEDYEERHQIWEC
jgi:hypothetical protein